MARVCSGTPGARAYVLTTRQPALVTPAMLRHIQYGHESVAASPAVFLASHFDACVERGDNVPKVATNLQLALIRVKLSMVIRDRDGDGSVHITQIEVLADRRIWFTIAECQT